MTMESVDTQAVTGTPRHFIDDGRPEDDIPEVAPLGDRTAVEAADEATLTAKFEEYVDAAPILVDHHDWERTRFDETYQHYVKIFTSLETLESIKQQTEAVAPSFDLLEEFEVIDLPDDVAQVTAITGGLVAVGSLVKAVYQARQASKALAYARFRPVIGPAQNPAVVAAAKSAKGWKILGAAGAALTVVSSGVGILATIENKNRRLEFLRDSVESYQNWYAATRQGIDDMDAASTQMEADITALLNALGFGSPEELEAFLGSAVQDAGQLQGALNSATRMLCASPPLSASVVAGYTGLPLATVQRRAALVAQDPGICSIGG